LCRLKSQLGPAFFHPWASRIIVIVKRISAFALSACVAFSACQTSPGLSTTVVAGGRVVRIQAATRVPEALLRIAGVDLAPDDQILNNGYEVDAHLDIPAGRRIQIQVRRPIEVSLNGAPLRTAAATVAEALGSAKLELFTSDLLDPPADTALSPGMIIAHIPSRLLDLALDGSQKRLRSATGSTGAALAEAGIPVVGLDSVSPSDHNPLPEDGRMRLARISESVVLVQESLAFESKSQDSPELDLGLEQVLEPGLSGLAVTRTRIRYEDGVEVSRQAESQAVVRQPKDRAVLRGTRIIEKTVTVDGTTITYWRTLQMYATVYSPCNSGLSDGSCSSGTASGLPAGKGVVAVDPDLFAFINGQRLYIPGYGNAIVGDVGGGYIVEQSLGISRYRWIDLGFDDDNTQDMTGWITVYFLAPVPASIPDALK